MHTCILTVFYMKYTEHTLNGKSYYISVLIRVMNKFQTMLRTLDCNLPTYKNRLRRQDLEPVMNLLNFMQWIFFSVSLHNTLTGRVSRLQSHHNEDIFHKQQVSWGWCDDLIRFQTYMYKSYSDICNGKTSFEILYMMLIKHHNKFILKYFIGFQKWIFVFWRFSDHLLVIKSRGCDYGLWRYRLLPIVSYLF